MINKKGSIGGWTETIMLSMLFIVLLTLVLAYMNATYGGDNDVGLDTSAISANGSFAQYTLTAEGQIEGGEAEQTDTGLSLTTSWAIGKGIFNVIKTVLTGQWVDNIVSMMMLPHAVAVVLKILFFASLIFAVIKLFFKVSF